jgi:large subunit ribosomal protein L25
MAKQETIQAEKREAVGTSASKRLRRSGVVPGVVYGSSQREYPVQLNAKAFGDVLKRQASRNFLVNLEIEGAQEKTKLAIVQDVQRDPLNGSLIHVDFRAVSEDETIHAVVPIKFHGEPIGVKSGGLLQQLVRQIEVHCRPLDLPEAIINDVDHLGVGDSLKVAELNLPEGVITKMDGEVLVGLVAQTRASVSAGGKAAGKEDKKKK